MSVNVARVIGPSKERPLRAEGMDFGLERLGAEYVQRAVTIPGKLVVTESASRIGTVGPVTARRPPVRTIQKVTVSGCVG